jgi:hypothetical protein
VKDLTDRKPPSALNIGPPQVRAIRSFGIDPVRTAYRSSWQNPIAERIHTRLSDSPDGRPMEPRPSPTAGVAVLLRVGGLHHRYVWAKAA